MEEAREREGAVPVMGYQEELRPRASDWSLIVFGYALLEFGAVVLMVMGAARVLELEPYQERIGGLACLVSPVSFVAALANCVWHFDQRPRPRWTWMPVCSVVLTVVSPLVPAVVGWWHG